MKILVEKTEISGVLDLHFDCFEETRGNIWTTYNHDFLSNNVGFEDLFFKHDKFSVSNYNVFRGFHGDNKSTKLVTCVYGSITQLVLDWRKDSETYGKVLAFEINRSEKRSILIPPGCGNAYHVKSDQAVYHYKLSYDGEYLDASDQFTVNWYDAEIKNFPITLDQPITSERDS